MVQTVATMISLLLTIGAIGIIAASIAEDWVALQRALVPEASRVPVLPPRTRQLVPARRARIVRFIGSSSPLHAAA